jgi:hypothetical protein
MRRKKLSLQKDTLRKLGDSDLARAAGGSGMLCTLDCNTLSGLNNYTFQRTICLRCNDPFMPGY